MAIELHERLSEFSYGYGVTREIESMFRDRGMVVTPFLPSLLHEAKLGFDVAFNRPGTPLLLQFKLGQALRRFAPGPRPNLAKQFWRFKLDTAEVDGQFELLLKAERDGADVFYVAPKFHDWAEYLEAFQIKSVLERSLIVRPSKIREALENNSIADGKHKIVYDGTRAYVCSEPVDLFGEEATDAVEKVATNIANRKTSIGNVLEEVYRGFENRDKVRRYSPAESENWDDTTFSAIASEDGSQPRLRRDRLQRYRNEGRTRLEAVALAVGAELWSAGAQLIFVTKPK